MRFVNEPADCRTGRAGAPAEQFLSLSKTGGQHIKKAVLFVRKAGGDQHEHLKITLSDVLVSSYKTAPQPAGSGAGPVDQFSLNYAIEYSYTPHKADGSVAAPLTSTYDLKALKT